MAKGEPKKKGSLLHGKIGVTMKTERSHSKEENVKSRKQQYLKWGEAIESQIFGFECDPAFAYSTGARMAAGVAAAEKAFAAGAAARGETPARFRVALQRVYRQRLRGVRQSSPDGAGGE